MNLIEQFPILSECTYLNTASSGILSKSLMDWRTAHELDYYKNGSAFRNHQAEFLSDVKFTVAKFFDTKPENTFLVPNFSFGFNTFLEGLSTSHRFLLIEDDYPSINYAVKSRRFQYEYVQADQNLEDNIIEIIDSFKPTIFACSVVQYINGLRLNFEFLKELKRLYPSLLIVADGTQFCGTESFSFEQSGFDVLISSGYKWMLAGYGNGFILMKDDVKRYLYQEADKVELPKEPFLANKSKLSLYFEPGHQDTLAFGSLKQSILFLEEVGIAKIERSIKVLSEKAKTAFATRGLLNDVVSSRENYSPIFNLKISEQTFEDLKTAKIIGMARGNGIRIAFNFFNTEKDLFQLLRVIDLNL